MYTSTTWLNDYLDPPASADELADLLTRAGFPFEGSEDVDGGDVRLDFEMTSNRGDCVCHHGLAREAAALSGRTLKSPAPVDEATGGPASELIEVRNDEPEGCPLYTGRVITGVTVGPSPDWLADRLRAIGQIPRNNIVDATNFVLFELGQPTHVFDLDTLRGGKIIIRKAKDKEPFLPIGEGESEVELRAADLVIADAERAVAIAGVKGGALTAVTDGTKNILIEAATFNPVDVRTTSRALRIASDSSYRFERGVHAAQVNAAADRLVELILASAGGTLHEGVVFDGREIPAPRRVSMRPGRCRDLLGVEIDDATIRESLERLGMQTSVAGDRIEAVVPTHRLDVEREIDVIEEVGRVYGLDRIPISDTIPVRVSAPQPVEQARRVVANTLVGLGFVESITHSLISEQAAHLFLREGEFTLHVDDERAGGEPMLRPSILPSLLRVRRLNQDNGVEALRLFETAATFVETGPDHHEQQRVTLLSDGDPADGLRPMRGVVERLVEILVGPGTAVDVVPDTTTPWLEPAAQLVVGKEPIGVIGMVAPRVLDHFGIGTPQLAAELELRRFYETYPPEVIAHRLPSFPAIERDISAIVDESAAWSAIETNLRELGLANLEGIEFVTAYRGKQVGGDRKSVTLRLRFRAPDRTLTHDAVDGEMDRAVGSLEKAFSAEIRR